MNCVRCGRQTRFADRYCRSCWEDYLRMISENYRRRRLRSRKRRHKRKDQM